jgi:hypothetical protein
METSIKFLDGILVRGLDLYEDIETGYKETSHYKLRGVIEQIGKCRDWYEAWGLESYSADCDVKVGDEVLVWWWHVDKGEKIDNLRRITYDGIIGKFVNGELVPLNGNVIYEGEKRDKGIVTSVGTDLKKFKHNGREFSISLPEVGDIVLTKYGHECEVGYRQTLDKKLFAVTPNNIKVLIKKGKINELS